VRKPKPINFYIEVISELKWDENSKKDSLEKLFFAIHDKPYWKDEAQLKKIVTSIREDANWIYNIYVGVTLNV
jgi:hypothetical protein